jgi:predicted molibdopterin-dependent oxidoreductase YjgC
VSDDREIVPGAAVTFFVNGEAMEARRGQTLAAALLANGRGVLRHTRQAGRPRGLFCAMGVCFDCVMTVDGRTGVRACMTRVDDGMQVASPARFNAYTRKT